MKFQTSAVVAAVAATAASAQQTVQDGPYYVLIEGTGSNTNISGVASACHAGAAIEGFCYSPGSVPGQNGEAYEFYLNYTKGSDIDGSPYGKLVWNLPATDGNGTTELYPQILDAVYTLNSNVAVPTFGFGDEYGNTNFPVGIDSDSSELFVTAYGDDSKYVPGQTPPQPTTQALYDGWVVCELYVGVGYYYTAVGWAMSMPTTNPTCSPVKLRAVTD